MATNHERKNALDRNAYMMGRDDARAGLPCYCPLIHPDNFGGYRAGWQDWHKLAAFPAMLAALRKAHAALALVEHWDAGTGGAHPDIHNGALDDAAAAIAAANGER